MIDVNEIPDQVLTDILQNMGVEDGDADQKDLETVSEMSAGECFDRYLIWNGICGYTGQILEAIDGLRAADSIQEIQELVNPADGAEVNADEIFTDVINVIDHHGHMGNETLKTIAYATRLATNPTGRALALLKIREVLG